MFVYVVVLFVLLVYALDAMLRNSRQAKMIANIPGPTLFPIVGNGFDIICGPESLFSYARQIANKYKGISKLIIVSKRAINLYDPQDIEILLSSQKQIKKGDIYMLVEPWLKDGLVMSTGEKWQKRRKILTPAFHFNILRQFCMIFNEHSNKMVSELNSESEKSETDILPLITDYTLNSISETAMGTNLHSVRSKIKDYKKAIYKMGLLIVDRFTKNWFYPPALYVYSPDGRVHRNVLNTLHSFTANVIKERRNERKLSDVNKISDDDDSGSKKKLAMLDLLLTAEAEGNIDEMGIREEVDTFMFEGHDTTTLGLLYCLMLLANHQDVQQLVIDELDDIFKDDSDTVTMEKLNNMNYLERCIKESLRLYPSVPFISRELTEDLQLKNHLIPAGVSCNVHIFDMHRNPELYPNPDKFDPDRFLPENTINRHPYAYIPFSAGPRNCIGQKFAILEEKALISAILRNFKLEPITRPEDIIFKVDVVLRCRDPIKIKFVPRISAKI